MPVLFRQRLSDDAGIFDGPCLCTCIGHKGTPGHPGAGALLGAPMPSTDGLTEGNVAELDDREAHVEQMTDAELMRVIRDAEATKLASAHQAERLLVFRRP